MDWYSFLESRSDKELDSFGYYGEIRQTIAEHFSLNLTILYNIEGQLMVRETLVMLYEKNSLAQACELLKCDKIFFNIIQKYGFYYEKLYKRFLFVTAPLVSNFDLQYLKLRDRVSQLVGYTKTYVFEMSPEFQKLCVNLSPEEFNVFLMYKDDIANRYIKAPKDKRRELLNLFFTQELYILDLEPRIFYSLFKSTNVDIVRKKIEKIIGKKLN